MDFGKQHIEQKSKFVRRVQFHDFRFPEGDQLVFAVRVSAPLLVQIYLVVLLHQFRLSLHSHIIFIDAVTIIYRVEKVECDLARVLQSKAPHLQQRAGEESVHVQFSLGGCSTLL